MITETDVPLADGRTLHVYDAGGEDRLPVVWHHGSPNLGAPPEPLYDAADRLGLRWVGYDRPAYGGSTRQDGRDIASAAGDVAAVADAIGADRFAVMGHSSGGAHALACAALLPERVVAAVSMAGMAPYAGMTDEGLDWFSGMADAGVNSLRAARQGRAAREAYEESGAQHDIGFTAEDEAALGGRWGWLLEVVRPALAGGPEGMIADDLAATAPWGFDPAGIDVPVLVLHGGRDRLVPSSQGEWVARHIPTAELRFYPDDSHITVLDHAEEALEWVALRARTPSPGGA